MTKTKFHKLHKIKIHQNRWLIWAVVYTLFVAIATVAFITISDVRIDAENALSIYEPWHSYVNQSLNYGLSFPSSWAIEAETNQSLNFLPVKNLDRGVNVTVASPTSEAALRKSLRIQKEESTLLQNIPAKKITNDLGNGHSELVIFAVHQNRLYVVRGSENLVSKVLLTFHFLK